MREAHKCGELSVTIPRESLREKGWREALEQAKLLTSPTTKPHILSITYKYGWVQHLILIPLTTSPKRTGFWCQVKYPFPPHANLGFGYVPLSFLSPSLPLLFCQIDISEPRIPECGFGDNLPQGLS